VPSVHLPRLKRELQHLTSPRRIAQDVWAFTNTSFQKLRNSMTKKVRIAIIGAGAVADYHHVPGIRLDPRAELVAACDPNEQLLQKRKTDWSITKITRNYAEIANDPAIDAVIICTPNDTHYPITLAC